MLRPRRLKDMEADQVRNFYRVFFKLAAGAD